MTNQLPLKRLVIGVFLVTCASLLIELTLTRLFSVLLWYHFAFLAISLGLVGISAGAATASLLPNLSRADELAHRISRFSMLACASAAFGLMVLLRTRTSDQVTAAMLLRIATVCIVGAIPFYFAGLVMAISIREAGPSVAVVYAADLLGAALGCLAFVPAMNVLGGPLTMVLAAVLFGAAGLVYTGSAEAGTSRWVNWALILIVGGGGFWLHHLGKLDVAYAKGNARNDMAVRWNSFSRVGVWKYTKPEHFVPGISDIYTKPPTLEQRVIDIDAGANTLLLEKAKTPADLEFLKYDITDLPFTLLQKDPHVLVIGPGGGRDVLLSLNEGASRVTAAEINPDIVDLVRNKYGEFSGHLYDDPKVDVVVRDVRSFLEADPRQYDLIMISLVDTWASSAAGAMNLTENLLYTKEAFATYMRRLKPEGVLSITRWMWKPERETIRVVSLARDALRSMGVADPSRHIVVAGHNKQGCVTVSKSPLSDAQIAAIAGRIRALKFESLYVPGASDNQGPIAQVASAPDLDALYRSYPFDITPPNDNRPFFFFTLRLHDLPHLMSMPEGRAQNIGLLVVLAAGTAVMLMSVLFILLPLWFIGGSAIRAGNIDLPAFVTYFFALGIGFMLLEIPLLQDFILFLGHPSASLSVVLFALLTGAGIGSFWTRRWSNASPDERSRRLLFAGAGACALVLLLTLVVRARLQAIAGWPLPARELIVALLTLPVGFGLGTFFPSGLTVVAAVNGRLVPWAIGLNGIASVFGSILAVACGILMGFWQACVIGVLIYVIAWRAFIRLQRSATTSLSDTAPPQLDRTAHSH